MANKKVYKAECVRCETKFVGRFGQKYCSARCRAANWYTLKDPRRRRLSDSFGPTKKGSTKVELNGNGTKSCPYCKGYLYYPAGQPYIIKCENLHIYCPKGLWILPEKQGT